MRCEKFVSEICSFLLYKHLMITTTRPKKMSFIQTFKQTIFNIAAMLVNITSAPCECVYNRSFNIFVYKQTIYEHAEDSTDRHFFILRQWFGGCHKSYRKLTMPKCCGSRYRHLGIIYLNSAMLQTWFNLSLNSWAM